MLILTLRTDQAEAEVGIYDDEQLAYHKWLAFRELSITLHSTIENLLKDKGKTWDDLKGIVAFKGPGSFTGLRIGLTVGNTLAYGLSIPIVSDMGDNWIQLGLDRIKDGDNEKVAMPFYGSDVHITLPKK